MTTEANGRRNRPFDPRLLRYARASRGYFVVLTLIALLNTAVIVAFAWLLTQALVAAIDGMPLAGFTGALTCLGVVIVLRAGLILAREALSARAAARAQAQLRARLISAIDHLGSEWLARQNSARLALVAGHGLDALEPYFGRYLPQLVTTAVAAPTLVVVMWWQDWISGLTVLITLPLIPLFMVLIGLATRAVQQKQWRTLTQLASRFSDTVRGLSTLIIYGRQHRAADSIADTTDRYRRETMRVLRVSFLSGFALEFLASISVAIVAVSIGFRLIDGALALTVGLFVLLLAPEAYLPLRQVGVQFHAAAEGVAATEDILAILDAAGHVPGDDPLRSRPMDAHEADASEAALAVQIQVHRDVAIAPIAFSAEPGTVTLIQGPSGVGKSSLFAALRDAAPYAGDIRWRGRVVREVRAELAWAGQRPGLIAGTVGDNIALGDPNPDDDVVRRALQLACADEIGPGLALGAGGAGLSGGQAGRVAVARAYYRHLRQQAPIIALDEPSSALDAETEARLWAGVRWLANSSAIVLLISHRRSAHAIADQVVTLGTDTDTAAAPIPAKPTVQAEPPGLATGFGREGGSRRPAPREPAHLKPAPEPEPAPAPEPQPAPSREPVTPAREQVRRVLRQAIPPARRFWPGAAAGFISEASAVTLLAVSAWLIVRASEQPPVLYLSVAVVGVRLFALTRAGFRYLERLLGHDAALRQLAIARTEMIRKLIPLAPDGLHRHRRGDTLAALVDDVDQLQNLPLRVVQPLLASSLVAAAAVVLVALISPAAALTLAACLLTAGLLATGWGWLSGARAERTIAPLRSQLSDALIDHVGSLDVLVAFGADGASRRRITDTETALRRATITRAAAQAGTAAVISLLAGAASLAALLVTAPNALDGPALAVAVLLPLAVFEVFAAVPLAASAWRGVQASAAQIAAVTGTPVPAELVRDPPPTSGTDPALGSGIELRDVSATWPGSNAPTLHGVNLRIAAGERILVTGSSGAGKSTLAHVLVRFLAHAGAYSVGGIDARTLSPDDLRRTVGLCEQDPMLFDEDIRQNLIFARDTATDDELQDALARVGLSDWLNERGGLSARVGERGGLVSGGQAQRISLARALLRGFGVLILDEPTVGVDPDASKALLTDLLAAVGRDQAVVLISHVAPPAGLIDRTVRIHRGTLVDDGRE